MPSNLQETVKQFPILEPYARRSYQGANDRRARSFRQAWDFAAEYGGVLQTVQDAAARRIMAARLEQSDDPALLPQHTRTLAIHYKSGTHWFIAFDDDPTRENLAAKVCHAYGTPSQYAAGWTLPLDGQVYGALERAQESGRILPHPAYDHAVSGTWFRTPLCEGEEQFEAVVISQALFGELAPLFAQAHSVLGREALHFHLPRTTDLDSMIKDDSVLVVPIIVGGAYSMSPAIHLEKSTAMRDGIDTYLASAPLK